MGFIFGAVIFLLGLFFLWGTWITSTTPTQSITGGLLALGLFYMAYQIFKAASNGSAYVSGSGQRFRIGKAIGFDENNLPITHAADGSVIGYKVVRYRGPDVEPKDGIYEGAMWGTPYPHNQLSASAKPTMNNTSGIYFTYDRNAPELQGYLRKGDEYIVARVKVWGKVVYHTTGGRAEHAEITKTFKKGG